MSPQKRISPPKPPLRGSVINSFAYSTISERLPVILTKVIDNLYKLSISPEFSREKQADATAIISKFSKFKYEMQRDRKFEILDDDGEDLALWNEMLADCIDIYMDESELAGLGDDEILQKKQLNNSWFKRSWLFGECYMYRLIRSAFLCSTHWRDFDVFAKQKQESFIGSTKEILRIGVYLQSVIENISNIESVESVTKEFIEFSLWGNMSDLSLHTSNESLEKVHSEHSNYTKQDRIIVDDSNTLISYLHSIKSSSTSRIDIILDNAGFELFSDLVLADWLCQSQITENVVFHVKSFPWFVSDNTSQDIPWTLETLATIASKNNSTPLSKVAARWKEYFDSGKWTIKEHFFWTLPCSFYDMQTYASDLVEYLKGSNLVLFKGDLNYRKIVYDCEWPTTTPFKTAIGPISEFGFPLAIFRTCKSDVAVGLNTGKEDELNSLDKDWMVDGKWGSPSKFTINELPVEIILKIASFLPRWPPFLNPIVTLSRSCKKCNADTFEILLLDTPNFYENICENTITLNATVSGLFRSALPPFKKLKFLKLTFFSAQSTFFKECDFSHLNTLQLYELIWSKFTIQLLVEIILKCLSLSVLELRFRNVIVQYDKNETSDPSKSLAVAVGQLQNLTSFAINYWDVFSTEELFNALCLISTLQTLKIYKPFELRLESFDSVVRLLQIRNLRHICLQIPIPQRLILEVIGPNEILQDLYLKVTFSSLQKIFETSPKLPKNLSFELCGIFRWNAWIPPHDFTGLQLFSLESPRAKSIPFIMRVLRKCPSLQSLTLKVSEHLDDPDEAYNEPLDSFLELITKSRSLRSLDLRLKIGSARNVEILFDYLLAIESLELKIHLESGFERNIFSSKLTNSKNIQKLVLNDWLNEGFPIRSVLRTMNSSCSLRLISLVEKDAEMYRFETTKANTIIGRLFNLEEDRSTLCLNIVLSTLHIIDRLVLEDLSPADFCAFKKFLTRYENKNILVGYFEGQLCARIEQ
ncbi:hypothetical protein HK098_002613 [Nowakowskiella sp. JEL0407]|nr:hypothetical protein HK098_002613 [Nowakowskiella sp. JEL0407]